MKKLFLCVLSVMLIIAWTQTADCRPMTPKEIYRNLAPGVVLIMATHGGTTGSLGTGSIITEDGLIITNYHVIFDQTKNRFYSKLYVFIKPDKITGDNRQDLKKYTTARVLRYNPQLDLALLKMTTPPHHLTVIPFADSDEIEVGDNVVAIGHPEQAGLWTLTTGTISSVIANLNGISGKDVFQTEASINRGNSGGPLLDRYGHMVGVNTMIFRQAPDGMVITDINFAIKARVAQKWLSGQGYRLALATVPKSERMSLATSEEPLPEHGAEAEIAPEPEPEAIAPPPSEAMPTPPPTEAMPTQPPSEAKPPVTAEPPAQTAEPTPEPTTTVEPVEKKAEVLTESRPYNIDNLIQQRMKEMEDLMEEMRQIFRK